MGFNKINELVNIYEGKWQDTSSCYEFNNKKISILKKIQNEKKLDFSINKIIDIIKNYPKEDLYKIKWKEEFYKSVKDIINSMSIIRNNNISNEMLDKFLYVSRNFILECKKFDNKLSLEDIGQALRNQWIISFLQIVKSEDIKLTKATFGYSLLYPYTDNFLDDPNLSLEEKIMFNDRFLKRLNGEAITARNETEEKVWSLVGFIEESYDRNLYEDVYNGLLYIHNGQIKSLLQQDSNKDNTIDEIRDISIEKGGASVLADGYLIDGNLSSQEEIFMFGYGVILQLADDLDDIKEDEKNNHSTIPVKMKNEDKLDNLANKILDFTKSLIEDNKNLLEKRDFNFKCLLIDGINNLVYKAIATSTEYYSSDYINKIEAGYPFRFSFLSKFEKNMYSKFNEIKEYYSQEEFDEILNYLLSE